MPLKSVLIDAKISFTNDTTKDRIIVSNSLQQTSSSHDSLNAETQNKSAISISRKTIHSRIPSEYRNQKRRRKKSLVEISPSKSSAPITSIPYSWLRTFEPHEVRIWNQVLVDAQVRPSEDKKGPWDSKKKDSNAVGS